MMAQCRAVFPKVFSWADVDAPKVRSRRVGSKLLQKEVQIYQSDVVVFYERIYLLLIFANAPHQRRHSTFILHVDVNALCHKIGDNGSEAKLSC
jgi:hypothetical protein